MTKAREFLDEAVQDTRAQPQLWVYPGLISAKGHSLLLGDPLCGKSIFAMQILDALWHQKPFLHLPAPKEPALGILIEADAPIASLAQQIRNRPSLRDSEFDVFPLEDIPLFPLRDESYHGDKWGQKLRDYIKRTEDERGCPVRFLVWGTLDALDIGNVCDPAFARRVLGKILAINDQCAHLILHRIYERYEIGRPGSKADRAAVWEVAKRSTPLVRNAERILFLHQIGFQPGRGRLLVMGRDVPREIQDIPLVWVGDPKSEEPMWDGVWDIQRT